MYALYRKPFALPSLILALLLSACDGKPLPPRSAEPVPDIYLEALQEAEALKYSIEEHNENQRRIEELIGGNQAPVR
jgi:hypothetical protein